MRVRLSVLLEVLCFTLVTLVTMRASAAPEAKILRIDPRAGQGEGAPIVNTVIELAQHKRLSEATADCALLRGDAQLVCMSERLAQPRALFTPIPLPPKENIYFTIQVDGADQPAKFVDAHKWGDSQNIAGVGTAWLIILDAGGSMSHFGDAQAAAHAFINALTAQDIADVMVMNDHQVVADTKWQPANQKAALNAAVDSARVTTKEGRSRPLFTMIRTAATDAFKDLGNAGSAVAVPLHQAMVVLSNGAAGVDSLSNGAGASTLSQYLTKGRFPEDNQAIPKTPLPVISVLFPSTGLSEEFTKNAQDFMTNLANPDIGGYFGVVRGNGGAAGAGIVAAVRDRFNQMYLIRWRVACVAPTVLQTFNLIVKDTNPPVAPDGSFQNVPIGVDPTTWPLDIDVPYTTQMAKRDPVYPGGSFKVYGNFCWGSNNQRAQVYFLPANFAPPATLGPHDIDGAKRLQQQLIAQGMDGKSVKAGETYVEFEAPDKPAIMIGKGAQAVSRIVVVDNVARRMSGATASTILTLQASDKPFPLVWIIAAAFGGIVVILLLVAIARGGGGGKGGRARPVAPLPPPPGGGPVPPPGGWGPPPGGAPPGGYGGAPPGGYGGAPPGGYGGAPPGGYGGGPPGGYGGGAPPGGYGVGAPPGGAAPAAGYGAGAPGQGMAPPNGGFGPAGTAVAPPHAAPGPVAAGPAGAGGAPNQDFLYGGKPPQYGLTTGQPVQPQPPPNPYGAASFGGAAPSRATLSGTAGVFTVLPGSEMHVGRDAALCQIVFQEPRVSGVHATVKLDGGQLLVRDERSNNGTHVNGTRIDAGTWAPVPPGSMLRFGPVELSVRLE